MPNPLRRADLDKFAAVATMEDAVSASSAILAAVAAGECTPAEGGRVMGLLTAHKSIVEMGDLERRIAALEERTKKWGWNRGSSS